METELPQHPDRKRVYEKFYKLLQENVKDEQNGHDLHKMALNIERGIFNATITIHKNYRLSETWNNFFKTLYINKAVKIYNNLNPKSNLKNTSLLNRLLNHEFNEFEMCQMKSEQLFPERHFELMQTFEKDIYKDIPRHIPVDERPDGILKCGKCKSYKTEYTEYQSRSADEPTTKRVECFKCGNIWKFC
jgi:DNA-directed RNA polymerase subunit M/transcription elongation factor TFIIS